MQKRRWSGWWSLYWCFGSQKNQKQIGHAAVIPETSLSTTNVPAAQSQTNTTAIALPFVAPPSSPASFFQSEPPSVTQSPSGLLSLTSVSAGMYSPCGRHSIFAIGPYAYETQLVSPPVFSTFTTEPSTAPFTPPSESVHLTTPSSPEVPFARLVGPSPRNTDVFVGFPFSSYEFPCYQLSPGSPVGQLISPRSVFSVSGTSSPFAGCELPEIAPNFLDFLVNKPPELLELEKQSGHEWGSRPHSGSLIPDTTRRQSPEGSSEEHKGAPHPELLEECQNDDMAGNHRASLEPLAEEVAVTGEPISMGKDIITDESMCAESETSTCTMEEAPTNDEKTRQYQRYRSITLGSSREINFESKANEPDAANKSKTGSASSTEEKVSSEGNGPAIANNWSFYPVIQPGVG